MRKRSASHDLDTFPSPGAPQYRGAGLQKGWASERVPPPELRRGGGRQIGSAAAAVMSFSSGRAVPSKWEDAERWVCSPFTTTTTKNMTSVQQPQKRPKSKSGPIVHFSAYSISGHSPAEAAEGGSLRSFVTGSPFSSGGLAAESVYGGGTGPLSRLGSRVPGWAELRDANNCCPSPKISFSSESCEPEISPEEGSVSGGVSSQRDMATQMSPRECRCSHSSPRPPPLLVPITELAKSEVRDVQVDKRAVVAIRWSRKKGDRELDISEAAMDKSRWQREEARITAWENLQKAKAEAAIRKLEMKLEKTRSATMDKIVDKLRTIEFRAHKMRTKLSDNNVDDGDNEARGISRTPQKLFSFRNGVWAKSIARFFLCCRAF